MHWQNTNEFIRERNRLNVRFVVNDLRRPVTVQGTAEFIVMERNRTSAHSVANVSHNLATYRDMYATMYTSTEDRISVVTVESRLSLTRL